MSMTVIPQPNASPPRVRIEVESSDPTKPLDALQIRRDGVPVRAQPQAGSPSVALFDYEAPFGVPVAYTAEGTTATLTSVFAETWNSLSGWSTTSGSPTVTGSHFTGGGVQRALAFPSQGQLTCQGLSIGTDAGLAILTIGRIELRSQLAGGILSDGRGTSSWESKVVSGLAQPFVLDWNPSTITLRTATGTFRLGRSTTPPTSTISAETYGPGYSVEDFSVSSIVNSPFVASGETTLDVDEAWMIHPTFPALSLSIDPGQHKFRDDGINVDAASKASATRAARATRHDLEGRRRAVVITSGPRAAQEWELSLRTRRLEDRDDVVRLIDDQSPLLLRSPASWPWDLPDDWYSVGDYAERRPREARLDAPDRVLSLPLVPVDPPIVRLGNVWTYGTDFLAHPTYRESLAALPTYLDRLVGEV